jgi:hypothetical protein
MSENSYSMFNAMVDIITAPGKALDEIKSHTSWLWWPLIITVFLASGLMLYYYNWVDFPWLIEETIRQLPAEDRAEAAGPIRQFMSVGTSTWTTLVAIPVVSLIMYTVQATYLHLANKLTTGAEIGFGQWFSFSVWTSFVEVFGALTAFVVIFMADSNQLVGDKLQALSLNSLIVHASPGDPLFTWANSLTLTNFWTLFLMSIGYARWTGATIVKSTIVAVLPWALVFGVWGVMA